MKNKPVTLKYHKENGLDEIWDLIESVSEGVLTYQGRTKGEGWSTAN